MATDELLTQTSAAGSDEPPDGPDPAAGPIPDDEKPNVKIVTVTETVHVLVPVPRTWGDWFRGWWRWLVRSRYDGTRRMTPFEAAAHGRAVAAERRATSMEVELQTARSALTIARRELELLAGVLERDRARVDAETAVWSVRQREADGGKRPEL